jgi:hypothetical protein
MLPLFSWVSVRADTDKHRTPQKHTINTIQLQSSKDQSRASWATGGMSMLKSQRYKEKSNNCKQSKNRWERQRSSAQRIREILRTNSANLESSNLPIKEKVQFSTVTTNVLRIRNFLKKIHKKWHSLPRNRRTKGKQSSRSKFAQRMKAKTMSNKQPTILMWKLVGQSHSKCQC